jgi:hypothetical protein
MTLDDFLPLFLHELTNCPEVVAKQAVLFAAMEFCKETQAWREMQDPTVLIDKKHTYELEAPDGAQAVCALSVWASDRQLVSKTMNQIADLIPNWQSAESSTPVYFNSVAGRATARLFPIPNLANRAKLVFRVAYQPTLTATELPGELVNEYHRELINGAKAQLYAQPKKDWTDLNLAAFYGQKFEADKVDTRIKLMHEGVPGVITVSAPAFGF